jgi:sugar phosphate isomerase/epimerase
MHRDQIAAQLYTVRAYLKTPADIAASLTKVKAIGYDAVQISGLGPIDAVELKRMCDGEGLVICATHEPGQQIIEHPEQIVERLHALGCGYTAYPWPHVPLETVAQVDAFCADLERSGAVLRDAGMVLCYHNHAKEFLRLEGRTVLERIFAQTDASCVQGEPDTYWVQAGGGSPLRWCERLKGRLPLLHLKDYANGPDQVPRIAELGNGNLDWDLIIPAADAAGCRWFIVEQDICPGDPFESLRISRDFLRRFEC